MIVRLTEVPLPLRTRALTHLMRREDDPFRRCELALAAYCPSETPYHLPREAVEAVLAVRAGRETDR